MQAAARSAGFPSGAVGFISNFEAASVHVLCISDIVIYGSFLEEQSFPGVLLQAMSLKRLIIAPDLPMISKYVFSLSFFLSFILNQKNKKIIDKKMWYTVYDKYLMVGVHQMLLDELNFVQDFYLLGAFPWLPSFSSPP